jgi:hypothetical protein
MSGEERRRSPRFAAVVSVEMTVSGARRTALLKDVCRDAALLEADGWVPLGAEVALRMELPGAAGPLEVSGRVIRLAPGEQGTHGMAILFSSPSSEAEARIDEFIAGRGPA